MALISCKQCGSKISQKATKCPVCQAENSFGMEIKIKCDECNNIVTPDQDGSCPICGNIEINKHINQEDHKEKAKPTPNNNLIKFNNEYKFIKNKQSATIPKYTDWDDKISFITTITTIIGGIIGWKIEPNKGWLPGGISGGIIGYMASHGLKFTATTIENGQYFFRRLSSKVNLTQKRKNNEIMSISPIIDRKLQSEDIQELICKVEKFKGTLKYGDSSYYEFKEIGFCLSFDKQETLVGIVLYSDDKSGYKQYQGNLPFGLLFSFDSDKVHTILGNPSSSTDANDLSRKYQWDTYHNLGITIEYNKERTSITSINIGYI